MSGSAIDPRLLFNVAPSDYVTERTRLAKLARTNGDKAGAATIKALKRPATAMWGVLAAGVDATAVQRVVEATTALADVQAAGGDSTTMAEAVGRRRAAVGSLVESAITELARWDVEARPRREEIRDLVDQLARRADLSASWIDGTLRDLPEHAVGFDAFANHDVPARLHIVATPPERPKPAAVPVSAHEPPSAVPVDELAVRREAALRATESPEIAARRQADREREAREQAEGARLERELADRVARQIEQRANAQHLADEAAGALREVEERLESARVTMRSAITSLRVAEVDHAAAEQRHREAAEVIESLNAGEVLDPP
jgi:hypothetical protein